MFEFVENEDGTILIIAAPSNDNEMGAVGMSFDPHDVNGYDDGDPAYVY